MGYEIGGRMLYGTAWVLVERTLGYTTHRRFILLVRAGIDRYGWFLEFKVGMFIWRPGRYTCCRNIEI